MIKPEILQVCGHHKPQTPADAAQIDESRRRFAEFMSWLDDALPAGREKALAKTKCEETQFWANAAIARAWGPAEPIKEHA